MEDKTARAFGWLGVAVFSGLTLFGLVAKDGASIFMGAVCGTVCLYGLRK